MFVSDFVTLKDVNGVDHLVQVSHVVEVTCNSGMAHPESVPLFEFHLSNGNTFLVTEDESKTIIHNLKKRMTLRKEV